MTAFVDGVTAYTVTRSEEYDGWIVVVVNSEEQGYHPAFTQCVLYFTEEKAQAVADNLNHQMGIYKDEELAVTACSMFPGTKYEDAAGPVVFARRLQRRGPGRLVVLVRAPVERGAGQSRASEYCLTSAL